MGSKIAVRFSSRSSSSTVRLKIGTAAEWKVACCVLFQPASRWECGIMWTTVGGFDKLLRIVVMRGIERRKTSDAFLRTCGGCDWIVVRALLTYSMIAADACTIWREEVEKVVAWGVAPYTSVAAFWCLLLMIAFVNDSHYRKVTVKIL